MADKTADTTNEAVTEKAMSKSPAKRSSRVKPPVKAQVVKETTEPAAAEDAHVDLRVKELSPHDYVTVRSGFHGTLAFKSPRTGERFVWEHIGDELDMELADLRNARTSARPFFENAWFQIDDPAVIQYLGIGQYYKHTLSIEGMEELFTKSADEIERILANISSGQKQTLIYYARQKIEDHEIDSIRVVDALEKGLGVQLIER